MSLVFINSNVAVESTAVSAVYVDDDDMVRVLFSSGETLAVEIADDDVKLSRVVQAIRHPEQQP